ncbi:hypothetical protein Bbelb_160470 [Branchiostoma belcheri]|nr:hypothetical protein Bbelb_160470 [Branchiostoma belcheri]
MQSQFPEKLPVTEHAPVFVVDTSPASCPVSEVPRKAPAGELLRRACELATASCRVSEVPRKAPAGELLRRACELATAEEERQAELVRRKRRWWVRHWLMRRPVYGQYESLMTRHWHT